MQYSTAIIIRQHLSSFFFSEVIVDSHAVVRNHIKRSCVHLAQFSPMYILQNYRIISQPGCWHWNNPQTLFRFPEFYLCVCVCVCVTLDLKWVSCKEHIYRTCFLILFSAILYLLIDAFTLFIFRVIIDRVYLLPFLNILGLFLWLLFVPFFFCSLPLWFGDYI